MQSSHAAAAVSSAFDDPNLIAYGGLEPVVRLAERCGLPTLAGEHIRLPASKDGTGAFPAAKVMSLVGGMAAGADSIEDMDRLRHGAMGRLFSGARAPSTLGSFLRSFTHGHVKQLHAVARRFLPELARHTPLLPGADQAAYVDIDDTIRRTYGYAKQGAGYGYSKVKGLNALLVKVSADVDTLTLTVGSDWRTGATYPKQAAGDGDPLEGTEAINGSQTDACMDVYWPYRQM
ncbi:hypothetical protein [Streptomyces sp. NPDC005969]|uniref:hypothetical protein n=1 Tax=Streptomyces sp. NPDC005969 TaxID=3156722 RepID=UPI0033C6A739